MAIDITQHTPQLPSLPTAEIPSNFLAGDYDKIIELSVADRAVYVSGT
ncbi:hypothetical protein [Paenibacillus sanguinis]|nr:hypothetical protein [Paenibacillus sanguinis]